MAKGDFAFPMAAERAVALGEIHARPYALVKSGRVIFQLAFMMDGGAAVHHAAISELSRARGVAPPDKHARHHALAWGQGDRAATPATPERAATSALVAQAVA